MGKLFALTSINSYESINLKCDPERALLLREQYAGIVPGYHMSKKHWNTITLNNDVSDTFAFELIDHSYDLVVKGLPKKVQKELENL
jgi:predicted DNA-binding protein (MmcQ/YjbR family)